MGKGLAALAVTAALATGNVQAEGNKIPDFSGLVENSPAAAQVVENTQAKIAPLTAETKILLAETETDGKIYTVYVIQQDGSKKEVKYTKTPNGIIIPPETNDGKLLDGSPATSNPKLNIGKNRMILAKYDKDTLAYANLDVKMVVNEADMYIKKIINLAQDGKDISRDDLFNAYYGVYIFQRLGTNPEKQLNGLDIIATKRMKIEAQELSAIKTKAESKAKTIIPVVTNAVG